MEYRIDVKIYGTAYIQADDPSEALAKANALKYTNLHIGSDQNLGNGVELSSAMTIHGPDDGDTPERT